MSKSRDERIVAEKSDQRTPFAKDRDRILYADAFARLNAVTQVASASETHVFHNRLTHSLKVAQVGRRIAEMLLKKHRIQQVLDPDVVETACLAHDLGHPPFGHVGEKCLHALVKTQCSDLDGFEGNAQSFRIVTLLENRKETSKGLNLCRATLDAILKYPWLQRSDLKNGKKWGAYQDQLELLKWVRNDYDSTTPSLEAQIMDWADEITYAAHDLQDFLLVGMIPPVQVILSEQDHFLARCEKECPENGRASGKNALKVLRLISSHVTPVAMKNFTSILVNRYLEKLSVKKGQLIIPKNLKNEVFGLTQLTFQYVIKHPSLATQQAGQKKILTSLFDDFLAAIKGDEDDHLIIPSRYRGLAKEASKRKQQVRLAADIVASLTEYQAIQYFKRLNGLDQGSILDSHFSA